MCQYSILDTVLYKEKRKKSGEKRAGALSVRAPILWSISRPALIIP